MRIPFMSRLAATLHILFVLGVQFAPTIHSSIPHREETASCTHEGRSLHFETNESDPNASPCYFCANQGSRSAPVLEQAQLVVQHVVLPAPAVPTLVFSGPLTLLLSESRGPPASL